MEFGKRSGESDRINTDRFFHVMGQGWFVLTREGVTGPYDKKKLAEDYVAELTGKKSKLNVSEENWRFNPL